VKDWQHTFFFRILGTLLLAWSSVTYAAVSEVRVSVDKNPVMLDESITLSVVADGEAPRDAFDPSPLLKDFVVGRTSVSSQTQMINFSTTRTTTWSTILIPRKQGRVIIPSFNVAGQNTQAITLSVIPVSASGATRGRDMFITTDVDMKEAYLQQQIRYTVKLHLAKDLQRGSLASPTLENADIRQIGKDAEYNDIIDGRRYRIIERTFAIIPQQSGKVTIKGPLFEGEVIDNTRQSFGFFNRSKTVNRVGPAQEINVLPIPNGYTDHWLPSDYVELHEEWQGAAEQYVAGEPITRTITLTAVGLVEEQLPPIESQYPNSIKTYPDQASTTTVEKDKALIAQRTESIALIPGQAGEYVIPEVIVPWFNIVTKKTEYARLPAREIQVKPAAGKPSNIQKNTSLEQIPSPITAPENSHAMPRSPNIKSSYWGKISGVFALIWLLTSLGWYLHVKKLRQARPSERENSKAKVLNERQAWQKLQQALKSDSGIEIKDAISTWLAIVINNPSANLAQCQVALNNNELNGEMSKLLDHLYGRQKIDWNAKNLHSILTEIRQNSRHDVGSDIGLKSLYPKQTSAS
jgi:hypothetical protein